MKLVSSAGKRVGARPQAAQAQVVCHMILRNSGHSEIISVCMGIFTIRFRKHKYYKMLNKNTLSYFRGV